MAPCMQQHGWKNRLRGTVLFVAGFVSAGVLMLFTCNWYPVLFPVNKGRGLATPPSPPPPAPDMNLTHITDKLMERVTINNITDNVYFTVRTSSANYRKRLLILMLTWFQTVNKNKLTIVSDSPSDGTAHVTVIRNAGFNLILTGCSKNHSADGLCCKTGIEFESYYKALRDNKLDEGSYQWFCHLDDDVYVNVPQLSHHLHQYDPHKPYYIGKWPGIARRNRSFVHLTAVKLRRIQRMNYTVKTKTFQYATGSAYCISHALMMEAEQFLNGKKKFCDSGRLVLYRDDMSLGFIIGVILGYNLTNIDEFHCQYEDLHGSTLQQILDYVTVGYVEINKTNKIIFDHTVPLNSPFAEDPTKFLAYHCLLYPQVSWCKNHWSTPQFS